MIKIEGSLLGIKEDFRIFLHAINIMVITIY